MQTYKKRFRKNMRTIKKRSTRQPQYLFILLKMKIQKRSKYQGGSEDSPKFKRLETMIIDNIKPHADSKLKNFIDELINQSDRTKENKEKKTKIFNQIFNEDVFVPTISIRDKDEEKTKQKLKKEHVEKVKHLLNYLNNGKDKAVPDDIDILHNILTRKLTADKIVNTILQKLDDESIKTHLTPIQIEKIKTKISGANSINGIFSSVKSSVKSSIMNGAISFGNWIAPDTDDNTPIKNKQKIHFLWYPRKHIDYKKGNSKTTRAPNDDIEYGDFVIMIEPEQYANTGEFFRQTYHSVEDLLATLLMGCDDMFCTRGVVKRKPYNWREYDITNNQPMVDKEKRTSINV